MGREAQAMMVTLLVAAHINKHGAAPLDAKLDEYFTLSEKILVKAGERAEVRENERAGRPVGSGG